MSTTKTLDMKELSDPKKQVIHNTSLITTLEKIVPIARVDFPFGALMKCCFTKQTLLQPTVENWFAHIQNYCEDEILHSIARLVVGITAMRERGHFGGSYNDSMGVSFLWKLVYDALTTDHFHFPTSSSAQGFLTVTICRHIVEGKLQELWRLHVWLPGGDPGHEGFSIHKHNAFGQSRFVAGQGTNHVWSIEEDAKAEQKEDTQKGDLIPLSKYRLEWTDTNGSSTAYKTNQTSSTVINTGKLVVARRLESTSHSSGMCYTIGEDEYHSSAVSKDRISATLFVFNSSRGHNNDEETIIGPRDQEKSTFVRCVADKTAKELCILVEKAIDQERCEPVMNKW